MSSYQDPRFDKKQYWYRRNNGWRGQYEVPATTIRHYTTNEFNPKPVTKKAMLKNTKRARKELAHATN